MKYSKTAMVAVCGALALAFAGCKYDDVEDAGAGGTAGGAGAGGADGMGRNGATVSAVETDVGSVTDQNGVPATAVPFDQDPNYVRCTDVEFQPVYFGFDASNLASDELSKIEAVATHLQQNPDRVVMVDGNCDERGSNEYNLSLGELRAISIRDYLVTLGIAAGRIQTKSYGEEKPAVAGSGEGAWSKNRRGEFAVFKHK